VVNFHKKNLPRTFLPKLAGVDRYHTKGNSELVVWIECLDIIGIPSW